MQLFICECNDRNYYQYDAKIEFLFHQPFDEPLGHQSSDPNASEALEEDIFDFTPFLDMSNIDLMNHALPDSLDIERKDDIVIVFLRYTSVSLYTIISC